MEATIEIKPLIIPGSEQIIEYPGYMNEAELSYFLSWAEPLKGNVLDVAACCGHVVCEIAPFVESVVALDFRKEMIQKITKRATEKKLKNIKTGLSSLDCLSFGPATFDGIICRGITHHIANLELFLTEIVRVLKSGGWFLLEDIVGPNEFSFTEELDDIEKVRDPSHIHFYTPEAWKNMITHVGLEQKKIEIAPKPYNLGNLFMKTNVPVFKQSFLMEKIFGSKGWLREYLRPSGEGEFLTIHYHKMIFYASKPY